MPSEKPPGPIELPLVGHTLRYAHDPLGFMRRCVDRYGDVVRIDICGRECYLVASPDTIETVLGAKRTRYRRPEVLRRELSGFLGRGIVTGEGESTHQRRQRVRSGFSPERLADYGETIRTNAKRLVDRWTDGDRLRIHEEMRRFSYRNAIGALLGIEYDEELIRMLETAVAEIESWFDPDPTRVLNSIGMFRDANRRRKDGSLQDLRETLRGVVREYRESGRGGGVLDALVTADGSEPSEDRIIDELVTILVVGHETVALALTYTWYLLSRHPGTEAELHAEIDSKTGSGRRGGGDRGCLDRILTEVLRLYPPIYVVLRESTREDELAGYRVPPKTPIFIPQWVVHRRERYYDRPRAFDPDRWTEEFTSALPAYAYFPFGGGPHMCIGRQFAMLEMRIALDTIGRRFRLEWASSDAFSIDPRMTLQPGCSTEMRIHRR